MTPSLVGTHRLATCDICDLQWPVAPDGVPARTRAQCFHCGQGVALTTTVTKGDIVRVQPTGLAKGKSANLVRGDFVAVRWDSRDRVKRIFGMPGDRIDLQGPILAVNDQRLEDALPSNGEQEFLLPWMLVDDDRKRLESRWQSDRGWNRQSPGDWTANDSDWLVYQHRSHHDMNRASPVWDDYPYNVNVNRKLNVVDRLRVTFQSRESKETSVEVAFWTLRGNHSVTLLMSERRLRTIDSTMEGLPTDAPVDERHPVAIRVRGSIRVSGLKLERRNQYRLRPTDDTSQYPFTLREDEYFVVGDNTPISIDSRSIGALKANQIIGKIYPMTGTTRNGPSQDTTAGSRPSQ